MLGGLAADQRAAGLNAALGHARNQRRHLFRLVFANGDVIQEKQRLGPAAHDIVDAHGHAVDAHGIMLIHQLGDALLGAYAVGARHQHGLGHTGKIGGKQPAKAADIADHTGNEGTLHVLFHQLDALVTGLNVHASGGVGCGMRFVVHGFIPFRSSNRCTARRPAGRWP